MDFWHRKAICWSQPVPLFKFCPYFVINESLRSSAHHLLLSCNIKGRIVESLRSSLAITPFLNFEAKIATLLIRTHSAPIILGFSKLDSLYFSSIVTLLVFYTHSPPTLAWLGLLIVRFQSIIFLLIHTNLHHSINTRYFKNQALKIYIDAI